eukprot:g8778.t1
MCTNLHDNDVDGHQHYHHVYDKHDNYFHDDEHYRDEHDDNLHYHFYHHDEHHDHYVHEHHVDDGHQHYHDHHDHNHLRRRLRGADALRRQLGGLLGVPERGPNQGVRGDDAAEVWRFVLRIRGRRHRKQDVWHPVSGEVECVERMQRRERGELSRTELHPDAGRGARGQGVRVRGWRGANRECCVRDHDVDKYEYYDDQYFYYDNVNNEQHHNNEHGHKHNLDHDDQNHDDNKHSNINNDHINDYVDVDDKHNNFDDDYSHDYFDDDREHEHNHHHHVCTFGSADKFDINDVSADTSTSSVDDHINFDLHGHRKRSESVCDCEHQNFDNHADCEHTSVNHRCSHNINLESEFHGCTRGLVGGRGYLPGGAARGSGRGGGFDGIAGFVNDRMLAAGKQLISVTEMNAASLKPTRRRVLALDWSFEPPSGENYYKLQHDEFQQIMCRVAEERVRFTWTTTSSSSSSATSSTSLYLLASEQAYVGCGEFANGQSAALRAPRTRSQRVVGSASSARVSLADFVCAAPGSYLFASERHCAVGHRVRVQVVDMARTAALRSEWNAGTNENHWTYAMVAEKYMMKAAFLHGFQTNQQADAAQKYLWCVEPHAPASCSDWLPDADNTGNTCLALVEADIGYKTELYAQMGERAKAVALFARTCASCGKNTLDMAGVVRVFGSAGWIADVADSECVPTGVASSGLGLGGAAAPGAIKKPESGSARADTRATGQHAGVQAFHVVKDFSNDDMTLSKIVIDLEDTDHVLTPPKDRLLPGALDENLYHLLEDLPRQKTEEITEEGGLGTSIANARKPEDPADAEDETETKDSRPSEHGTPSTPTSGSNPPQQEMKEIEDAPLPPSTPFAPRRMGMPRTRDDDEPTRPRRFTIEEIEPTRPRRFAKIVELESTKTPGGAMRSAGAAEEQISASAGTESETPLHPLTDSPNMMTAGDGPRSQVTTRSQVITGTIGATGVRTSKPALFMAADDDEPPPPRRLGRHVL